MNRITHNLTYSLYMGIAGGILGVNTGLYITLTNKNFNDHIFYIACAGFFGGTMGISIGIIAPQVVPIYIVSIPCYFGMKYLIKKELI